MNFPGLLTLRRLAQRIDLKATRCVVCGTLCHEGPLCPECRQELKPRTGGYCPRCGRHFGEDDDTPHLCASCRSIPPPWNALGFHGAHEGLLRELVLTFKFRQGLHLTALLRDMTEQAFSRMDAPQPELIVPVPLHRRRLVWRGYNQSLELSRGITKRHHIPLSTKALLRTRNTIPQTQLEAEERRKNIRGAFKADEEVQGKSVLLVDDVLTTGATLEECAKTLHRAGASAVAVLVLSVAEK